MGFVGVSLSVSHSLDDGDLALPGADPQFRLVVRLEKYVCDPHHGNRTQLADEKNKPHDSTLAAFLSLGNSGTTKLMSTKISLVPDVDLLSHEHLGPSIMRYAEEEARMGARLMRLTMLEVMATVVYVVGLGEECAGTEVMPPETPAIDTYRFRSATMASFLELTRWEGEGDDGCAVCWEEFGSGETVARTRCRHVFHRHCILNWMHQQGTCPLCRYSPWNPHEL